MPSVSRPQTDEHFYPESVTSAVFAMSATTPVYSDSGKIAAVRRTGVEGQEQSLFFPSFARVSRVPRGLPPELLHGILGGICRRI